MALKDIVKGRNLSRTRTGTFQQTPMVVGDWNNDIKDQITAELTADSTSSFSVKTDDFTAEDGFEYVVNKAAGAAIVLPAVTAGASIVIVLGITITSNTTTITAEAGDLLIGYSFLEKTDGANAKTYFAPDGTDDLIITLNGSTKGGLIGDRIELIGISDTEWRVRATLSHTGGAVTPFS